MDVEKHFDIFMFSGEKTRLFDDLVRSEFNRFSYIVTPNVNHVVMLLRDNRLREAYDHAFIRLCDSRILGVLSKFCGRNIPVYPGSDLTKDLIVAADMNKWRVCVVGAESEDIFVLANIYKDIEFVHYAPPMGFINNQDEVKKSILFVEHSNSNLVLLALGCPRQEYLAELIYSRGIAKGLGLCIGASVLFLSGRVKRAPRGIQLMGLEWLYRIFAEPKRLFWRYAYDGIHFLPMAIREIIRARKW